MNFTERLISVQNSQRSLLCVGLDTDARMLPAQLGVSPEAVLEFNRGIIGATRDLVCAYKINLAFYEALGSRGWEILTATVKLIPRSVLIIGDAKRGDIGNTAERYAAALFEEMGFDAVTVNPLMGFDSVEPFLNDPERGVFLLALTSNPGSRDFQRLRVGSRPLYEKIVLKAKKWNSAGNIGLVVGATHPSELKRIRSLVPRMPVLIPGVGAQGGDLVSAVRFGCARDGNLALINVSRGVIYASRGDDYAAAARAQAERLQAALETARTRFFSTPL